MSFKEMVYRPCIFLEDGLAFLIPAGDLFIRFWVAQVFFFSSLTKLDSWDSTIALFTYEYHVPLLSPEIAAVLGTSVEFSMPIFIALGLGGRLPALILFLFNIVAVISYPFLWTEAGAAGLREHFYWGVMLLVIMLYGVGRFSLDRLIQRMGWVS